MIGHEAVGPNFNGMKAARFGHQININPVVVIAEEGLLPSIPALGDVVRNIRGYNSGDAGHNLNCRTIKVGVPGNLLPIESLRCHKVQFLP